MRSVAMWFPFDHFLLRSNTKPKDSRAPQSPCRSVWPAMICRPSARETRRNKRNSSQPISVFRQVLKEVICYMNII